MKTVKQNNKRSKKKLFIWLGSILGALILIIGVGGYFAINYAADKVLDSMIGETLEPTNLPSNTPSPSLPEEPSPSASADAEGSGGASEPLASPEPTDVSPSKPESSPSKTPGQAEESKSNNTSSPLPPSKTAKPSPSPSPSPSYQAEITTEKAENVKENISFAEKTKVLTVMLKRLNADDIKTLQQLASGGLTIEKKKEAKALILEKLTEEEYDDLIKIAKKYGLSQGTSYEESQKQDLSN